MVVSPQLNIEEISHLARRNERFKAQRCREMGVTYVGWGLRQA
jgi:hypothetical protein